MIIYGSGGDHTLYLKGALGGGANSGPYKKNDVRVTITPLGLLFILFVHYKHKPKTWPVLLLCC